MLKGSIFGSVLVAIALVACPAMAQQVWTFDADVESWTGNGFAPITWDNGALVQGIAEGSGAFDPIIAHGTAYSADTDTNLSMSISVSGFPDGDTPAAYFSFPAAGGHTRSGYTVTNGAQVIRFNILDSQAGSNGDHVGDINNGRLDIPDNTGFAAVENGEVRYEWIAIAADANIDPEAGAEGEGEGEGEGPVVFRFDCDTEGFVAQNNVTVDHTLGWLVVKPTGGDPHTQASVSVAGTLFPEFGALIEVQNAPDTNPFPCALFWFADGGHGRAPFSLQDGVNEVRFNIPATKESGGGNWDDTVNAVRLDLPDGGEQPLIDADTTFLIDVLAFSDSDAFIPDPWTLDNDCDNDGLSNDQEAALGLDPQNADTDGDGVSDGIEVEFGSDPLDPQDFVTVPAMNYLGLGLTALLLAAAALVLVSRRRTTSH